MHSFFSKIWHYGLALIIAGVLALLSVYIQRNGPELAAYGNLCGPTQNEPCDEPVLNGGFPFAFLFDRPGISVERKLDFVEDKLHLDAFLLDVAVYFIAILLVLSYFRLAGRRVVRHIDA